MITNDRRIIYYTMCLLFMYAFQNKSMAQKTILNDPLTSTIVVDGEINKIGKGGQFTAKGWQATEQGGYLLIECTDEAGFEGTLEVDILNFDVQNIESNNGESKIHFINMFSNSIADHHTKHGGTATDALWTLRTGTDDKGKPRYGSGFKVLWASKGAKESENSDYTEKTLLLPKDWKWNKTTNTFKITWSKNAKSIHFFVNKTLFLKGQWKNQESALRYIYLAKSPDFRTLTGPIFSNLKVYSNNK